MDEKELRLLIGSKIDEVMCEYRKKNGISKCSEPDLKLINDLDSLKSSLADKIMEIYKDAKKEQPVLYPVENWRIKDMDFSDYMENPKYYTVSMEVIIGKLGEYDITRPIACSVWERSADIYWENIEDYYDEEKMEYGKFRFYNAEGREYSHQMREILYGILSNDIGYAGFDLYTAQNIQTAAGLMLTNLLDTSPDIYRHLHDIKVFTPKGSDREAVDLTSEAEEINRDVYEITVKAQEIDASPLSEEEKEKRLDELIKESEEEYEKD